MVKFALILNSLGFYVFELLKQLRMLLSDRLSEDSNNWNIGFGSNMMASTDHRRCSHDFMLTLSVIRSNTAVQFFMDSWDTSFDTCLMN